MSWERGGIFVLTGSGKWKSAAKYESLVSGFCVVISVWDLFLGVNRVL